VHCPECGFVNVEGANYCQKCGAFLGDVTAPHEHEDTTAAWQLNETGDLQALDPEQVAGAEATLVIRAGGGRAGEAVLVTGDQMTIGRSPEAGFSPDDVTVPRTPALLVRRREGVYIDDLASLNGPYVNRRRIESHKLQDGDELQVG